MRACDAAIFAESIIADFFFTEMNTTILQIGKASTNVMKVGEEAMTEVMLSKLQLLYPDVVKVFTFTKGAEKINGSDWAWQLKTPFGDVRMLVQAKRPKQHVSGIISASTINIPKDQYANLIKSAELTNTNPVYSLYIPGARKLNCIELIKKWANRPHRSQFDELYPLMGAIYLVPAKTLNPKTFTIDPSNPPGITLAELLCCVYDPTSNDDEHQNVFEWKQQIRLTSSLSFEGFEDTLQQGFDKSIKGIVEFNIKA